MNGRHSHRDDHPVAWSPRNMDFSFKKFRPFAHAYEYPSDDVGFA